jgi:hypothetical protein
MEQPQNENKNTLSTYLPKEESGMSYPINSTALLVIDYQIIHELRVKIL